MTELLTQIIKQMVDKPDEVALDPVQTDRGTVLRIQVSPDDVGKVIGREGRIINAPRQIVKAAAGKRNQRVTIELLN